MVLNDLSSLVSALVRNVSHQRSLVRSPKLGSAESGPSALVSMGYLNICKSRIG